MMARYTCADVIVVGLIGERGREVKDFIENIPGRRRSRPVGYRRASGCLSSVAYAGRCVRYAHC
ncbi:hypothetical protein CWS02_10500 [Enterobacter sp. EA-1]|nr:hypothetical protein CWS02_10500 [Enterobacter sp. EA-1]